MSACALTLVLCVSGCGDEGDDAKASSATTPTPTSTADAEEAAVIAAYADFLTEKRTIQNSGDVPADAYAGTVAPRRIEKERAEARQYAESGLVRVGQSEVKDAEVVDLSGDRATLLLCENEDGWGFKPRGKQVQYPESGWGARGVTVVRVDGRWLIADGIEQDRLPAKECA